MSETVASRDLRNHTAEILRRVQQGERLTVLVNGRAVAELAPLRDRRRSSIPAGELAQFLRTRQADPGMRADLLRLGEEGTDELGPIE